DGIRDRNVTGVQTCALPISRALRKKRIRKTVLVAVNIIFALFMLFPLLYSVSVSIMPGDELFTMDLNIIPSHPTVENYIRAFTQDRKSVVSGKGVGRLGVAV